MRANSLSHTWPQPMISLTEQESALIVDALNGIRIPPEVAPESVLWQEIADAIHLDHLDAKWQVDGAALIAKLKGASREDAARIVHLAEEFWGAAYRVKDTLTRVREIGLANAAPPGDELLTPSQAAKLCGKSVAALGQLAAKGRLKIYRDLTERNPRRQTRYLKSEIEILKASRQRRKDEEDYVPLL